MSYTNLLYHVVFATKERAPLITNELRPQLHQYLGGTARGLGGIVLAIGGVADHVHLLVKIKPVISVAEFIKQLKANSSGWANKQTRGRFSWQSRYGAFTVSESQIEKVRSYILRQEEHHRRASFEEEFKALLRANQIEFDEKYLWTT
ncbi:MAG TPA: IS200/IS605 family transposase [Pyrinomonadaceae bacterium]|jgi:REP element-mobilizing transposase RayT